MYIEPLINFNFFIPPHTAVEMAAQYNKYAKTPIQPEQAHLLLADDFEADLVQLGETIVEIGRFSSLDGNPHTFTFQRHQFLEERN